MSSAPQMVAALAARVAQDRMEREARGAPPVFEAPPNDSGRACCSGCGNRITRSAPVGIFTVHFGKPELRCGIDGKFRSPELRRDCAYFERV